MTRQGAEKNIYKSIFTSFQSGLDVVACNFTGECSTPYLRLLSCLAVSWKKINDLCSLHGFSAVVWFAYHDLLLGDRDNSPSPTHPQICYKNIWWPRPYSHLYTKLHQGSPSLIARVYQNLTSMIFWMYLRESYNLCWLKKTEILNWIGGIREVN